MSRRSPFDRFADRSEHFVSKSWFFGACALTVIIWAPTFMLFNIDTWQLIINTLTTIVTFLLLALLTNTQRRFEERTDEKLDAILAKLED